MINILQFPKHSLRLSFPSENIIYQKALVTFLSENKDTEILLFLHFSSYKIATINLVSIKTFMLKFPLKVAKVREKNVCPFKKIYIYPQVYIAGISEK